MPGRIGPSPSTRCCDERCLLLHLRRNGVEGVTVQVSEIEARDKVVLWYISANGDRAASTSPFKFDIVRNRTRTSPSEAAALVLSG